MAKPRIDARCTAYLLELDGYIRRYDVRGEGLRQVASDCFDGALVVNDLDPLALSGLIELADEDGTPWCDLGGDEVCGDRWTVYLSEFAVSTFWPERTRGVGAVQTPGMPAKLPAVATALSMCMASNSEAKLPVPMCWDLALYVQRLEAALRAALSALNDKQEEKS